MRPEEFFKLYPIKTVSSLIEFIDYRLKYGIGVSIDNEPSEAQITVKLAFDETIIGLTHIDEESLLTETGKHFKGLGWDGVRTRRVTNVRDPVRTKLVFMLIKFTPANPYQR